MSTWTASARGRVIDGARTVAVAASPELAEQITAEHNAHERLVRIENAALRIASCGRYGDSARVPTALLHALDAALEATS